MPLFAINVSLKYTFLLLAPSEYSAGDNMWVITATKTCAEAPPELLLSEKISPFLNGLSAQFS